MKLNSKDWLKLRVPLLSLLAAILLTVLLVSVAANFDAKQALLLKTQNDQLQIASQKYLSSGSEKQTIISFLPKYQRLIDNGFIGEERRQLWIRSLQDIQKQFMLFPIEYKINPLEQVKPTFYPNLQNFVMHQSTMTLDFDMLHEGDILKLTEKLADKQHANWLLRECDINRLLTTKTNGANLTTHCTIDWFTLLEPTAR